MGKFSQLSLSLLTGALASFLLIACGGGGDSSNGGSALGPASDASFVGVTIDINPRITFIEGNGFIYNNTGGNTNFPPNQGGLDLAGIYTYIPDSNFQTAQLRLDFTSVTPDIPDVILTLSSFVGANNIITGFTATYNGVRYPVVVSGAPLPQAPRSSQGGSTPSSPYENVNFPAALHGSYGLYFDGPDGNEDAIPTGFEYSPGAPETLVINSNGTVLFGGRALANPRRYTFSNDIFIQDPSKNWWLAIEADSFTGAFRRVKLYRTPTSGTSGFLGQFTTSLPGEDDNNEEETLAGSFSGTVTSRQISQGTPPSYIDFANNSTLTFTASPVDGGGLPTSITLGGRTYNRSSVNGNRVDYLYEPSGEDGSGNVTITFRTDSASEPTSYTEMEVSFYIVIEGVTNTGYYEIGTISPNT